MRLSTGQLPKDFRVNDIFGKSIPLSQYSGKHVLLSFYKWASCPMCNLRVHRLSQQYAQFQSQGLEMIAVFHSPVETLRQHMEQRATPFPIIADPQMKLYRDYGVEKSLFGMMKASLRMGDMFDIMKLGFLKTSPEGDLRILPADFLIAPDQRIKIAYYGSDIGDHLSTETIQQSLSSHERLAYSR